MRRFYFYVLLLALGTLQVQCQNDDNGSDTNDNSGGGENYKISALKATGEFFSVSSEAENARGIQVIGDSLLYVHARGNQRVVAYRLAEHGDITSAEWYANFETSSFLEDSEPGPHGHGIFIRPSDLKKMWLFNRTEVWSFDLTEAGNVASAVEEDYLDLSEFVERGHGIFFDESGEMLYVDDRNNALVHQFELTEAWQIAAFSAYQSLDLSENHRAVRAVTFHPDGQQMYLLDTDLRALQTYNLATPWNVGRGILKEDYALNISNPRGFCWNQDGSKAYVMNTDNGRIFEYVID